MEIVLPCNADEDDDDVLDFRVQPKTDNEDEGPKELPLGLPTPALWPTGWP